MANSINTNVAAYFAQSNISVASNNAASSVSRLSSGNRIVKSSDDVAALSIGTSLQTGVSALKVALTNASQGTSLLQVADGGLSQITSILQRQKAIALQAGSGSLTNSDRGFLDIEFQELSKQIDSITNSTTFNSVKLLNGSLSTTAAVENTETASTKGSLSTTFVDNIRVGESVIVNGQAIYAKAQGAALTADNQFNVGSTLAETVSNLADRLNTLKDKTSYNTTFGAAKYSANGGTLTATARSGGSLSNAFSFGIGSTAATGASVAGTAFTTNSTSTVSIATVNTSGFAVGQSIILNRASSLAVDGVAAKDLRGVITAISDGVSISFTAQTAATASNTNTEAVTIALDVANGAGESDVNGSSIGGSFNLFATTTGFTSATTQIATANADATTIALAFKNGDTLKATVNGIQSSLYTFTSAATLTDLVNGINATKGDTGFSAALVYDGSTYNVRIDYQGNAGNILLDGGSNYHSAAAATNNLTGTNLSATTDNVGLSTFGGKSLVASGYINLLTSNTNIASTTDAEAATILTVTANLPFLLGGGIFATVNGQQKSLVAPIVSGATIRQLVAEINAGTSNHGIYALEVTNGANTASNLRLYFTTPTPASDAIGVSSSSGASINSTGTTLTAAGLTITSTGSFKGGVDDGISKGGVAVTGAVGDSIVQTLGTTKANASILFTAIPAANEYFTVGGQSFYFTSNTNRGANEILIGSTIQESINNAVSTISQYQATKAIGTAAYELNQLNITATANSLVFTAKGLGDVKTLTGGNAAVSSNLTTSGALVGGTLTNDSGTYGVDVTGIDNAAFNGTLQGFNATYTGTANTVDLSITIGDFTYTAEDANAVVTSDTRIRFYSNEVDGKSGGYFDVQLKANQVQAFSTQAAADVVASRLDGAFSSLSFLQTRIVSSFGAVDGASSLSFQIGETSADSLSVSLGSTKTDDLFNGATLSVATQDDAEIASAAVDDALSIVTGLRAKVGALQSRFNYASANIQTSVQNQDAARGSLLDTDVATESTAYATSQVKLQAGISVLAQANQQLQALLKLIG
ncbi:MAG: hypothetical protein EBR02_03290 [Alphaproteobacteria bacterium]|nr:hypothetical protein [Alphaproteobacteria bacterium]